MSLPLLDANGIDSGNNTNWSFASVIEIVVFDVVSLAEGAGVGRYETNLYQELFLTPGATYVLQFDVNATGGTLTVTQGAGNPTIVAWDGASLHMTQEFVAAATCVLTFVAGATFNGVVDNVSVKEKLGTQSITTSIGADIEEIQPGETCRFVGFGSTLSDIFRDNMIITKVTYNLDSADIEVEIVKSGLIDFQNRQGSLIADLGNGGLQIPESTS